MNQPAPLESLQGDLPLPRNTIAVASGKGGVGKTWLAIGLAQAFAETGARTLLFDGDLGLANVDVQLGLSPDRDLGDFLAGRSSLRDAATSYAAGGFDVLAGRSGSGSLAMLQGDKLGLLATALHELAADYDRVILDLGAGIDHTVRQLVQRAATSLIVVNDEPTSLTDAYALIKLTLMRHPQADLRIVVNMAGSAATGEKTYRTLRKACESFLKASPPLAGLIERDSFVPDSIRRQTPILTRHPNATAAAGLRALARRLSAPPAAHP